MILKVFSVFFLCASVVNLPPPFNLPYNCAMDDETQSLLELATRLVTRLERLSVDSSWAHRASGMRGGLIKAIEDTQQAQPGAVARLEALVQLGYRIVEAAAREIPER
jgi:hypothetical protein